MPSFSEVNTKVNVSIGLIIALCAATFAVTSFYIEMSTLEERGNKRYERHEHRLERLEKHVYEKDTE